MNLQTGRSPLRPLVASLLIVAMSWVAPGGPAAEGQSPRRSKDYGMAQVRFINDRIREVWDDYQLVPSRPATDGEWCRRVYLDVLGRIPSVEELEEFTKSRDPNKKRALVDKLLTDEQYVEQYARNWTTIWTNILIGRSGGTQRNSVISRAGMQKYLRDCFARNKPYDEMVFELITATGSNTPGQEDFNGATNFLAMKVNEDKGTLATSATARIFLGRQVQCTQCHNHPFNEWKQQKFWEFNAFFRQTRTKRPSRADTDRAARLVDEDFAGEDAGASAEDAAIYYELRNGLVKVAYPAFIDGTEAGRSGQVQQLNRRQKLGELMLESQFLDEMIANRYWAHFLGYGFTKPVDDMGPHNPPTHPALLDYLGQQVRDNEYDLKQLIRWITLSQPYSLSSKTTKRNEKDDPQLGETPKFSHFYLRQMRAEELYESLLVATKASETRGSYEDQERLKSQWLSQFVTAFGNDEGEETTTFNGTIPQALMMFNGRLMRNATRAERGSFLWDLVHSDLPWREKIDHLYLAGLARQPTRQEYALADKLLMARASDQVSSERSGKKRQQKPVDAQKAQLGALQDMWWAVLNSNEFIINH